jgi:hypothetical protein
MEALFFLRSRMNCRTRIWPLGKQSIKDNLIRDFFSIRIAILCTPSQLLIPIGRREFVITDGLPRMSPEMMYSYLMQAVTGFRQVLCS